MRLPRRSYPAATEQPHRPETHFRWIAALVVLSLLLLGLTVWIYSSTKPSNLEVGLLQFIFLLVSTAASFAIGRETVLTAAREVIRPHADKSIRRIVNLTAGIQTFSQVVDLNRQGLDRAAVPSGEIQRLYVEQAFDTLDLLVTRELLTAEDAIGDWQDIAPKEVAELERRVRSGREEQA
jgi:hypothetical protein